LDFIGEINLTSTMGHRFVLTGTDYFTKWVETIPLKNISGAYCLCVGTYRVPFQYTADLDDGSRGGIYVAPVQGICNIIRDQTS
jgi:hypothetical protein